MLGHIIIDIHTSSIFLEGNSYIYLVNPGPVTHTHSVDYSVHSDLLIKIELAKQDKRTLDKKEH